MGNSLNYYLNTYNKKDAQQTVTCQRLTGLGSMCVKLAYQSVTNQMLADIVLFGGSFGTTLIVSHLKSALFHGICPARFTSSLKLLFSPRPVLGAPLSSYLEGALYKFHR